jgi:pimeloyl-ACP methyl ester carboxylesterase
MKRIFSSYIVLTLLLLSPFKSRPAEKQEQTGYSAVNGIKMYYEIRGQGEPLVLIHGGGSTIETTFGRVIGMLAKKHKVIAMDLQAHGRTSDRNGPESFEQDADDVAQLLKNLHIYKADFFGFSNGSTTAIQIAIRHPEIVNKLVLGFPPL